jgi:PAS domain S-box-containing protein
MAISDEAFPIGESSSPPGEDEARLLNAQLLEQANQLRKINQELVDREELLRLSVETGKVGVWLWDASGSIHTLDWSRRLKEIFGLPPEDAVTRELFLECVHSEDRERVDWAIMQSLSGVNEGFYNIEYRIIHPGDQSLHWVTAQGQAFFNGSGQSIRFIGAVVDISDRKQVEEYTARLNRELEERITERTSDLERANQKLTSEVEERKKAEDAHRQSEDYFRKAIDTIPGLVWSSLPDGHIDYLNQRWLDFTGLSHDEASGWGWQTAVHPDDLPGLVIYWKSILALQEAGEYEARLRRFDGQYRWFLFRGVPLRDEEHKLIKWYGTNTDIEDRRASEHLARGQLNALARTLDSLSRESDPEQLPKHVVTTIATQMSAHSVTIWERNGDVLDLLGIFEEGRFRTRLETGYFGGSIPVVGDAPPMWVEALQKGDYAVIEDIYKDNSHFILSDGRSTIWRREDLTPTFVALKDHMVSQGVRGLLVSPMMLAGRLEGIVGIRFTGDRTFTAQDIELMKALAHQGMLVVQLMRLSRQSREAAVTAERNRMARDIHDTLAQGFTGVIAQLQAAKGSVRLADASTHIQRAEDLARSSLAEARRSVRALRPSSLREASLSAALESMIKTVARDAGLEGQFVVEGEQRAIPPEWEEGLLRVTQESLTNTIKHAQAQNFRAALTFEPHAIILKLSDDGRGFNPRGEYEGFGLVGMKERVDRMGGTFVIHSETGRGTETVITLECPSVTKS